VDALKKCENDAEVVLTVARLFWSERNIDKARTWFQRALKLDADRGDAYAWWLKFEMEHGTLESQQDVVDKCVHAEPHHGERWCRVAKDPAHWRSKTDEILRMVVVGLPQVL
jgi:pre-mRNA-processing factor 6